MSGSEDHPLPGALALFFVAMGGLLSVVQGIAWAAEKMWPPNASVTTNFEVDPGAGGNYSVTVENDSDQALVVTHAVFRATPPTPASADAVELLVPAVTYDIPFDCAPGIKQVRLNPPFKIAAKDTGAVVFRSTVSMQPCDVYISLKTSRGLTKEKAGVSLAAWRSRAP